MKKRTVAMLLSAVMAMSLLSACGSSSADSSDTTSEETADAGSAEEEAAEEASAGESAETGESAEAEAESAEEDTAEEETAEDTAEEAAQETSDETITDGYIAAPYTADADATPTEYLDPVFYYNEDGPTISVIYTGVIVEDGKYFRDSDNDGELDVFEDWREDTDTRVADLLEKLTTDQRIGLLENSMRTSPGATSAEEVYDEDGNVIFDQLVGITEDSESFLASYVLDTYNRSGIIRKDTDTETGALFNNALNQLAEYVGVVNSEVTVPYMLISNPMTTGFPSNLGFGAAATGDGNADAIKAYAELDAQIWDAKGIHMMYGPQIDLITDPRWSRNSTTYTEDPDMMAEIATALVTGYQGGTDGAQAGEVSLIVKHFPGDGAAYNGFESHSWIGSDRIYSTEGSLETYQLVGFQAAIDAGVDGIMPGYSRATTDARNVTQTVDGVEITAEDIANIYSETLLQTLLKDIMGFDGFINSDSGIISILYAGAEDMTVAERYAAAINAGADVIVDTFDYSGPTEAVESGLITDEAFDRATTNRMEAWIELGMFENPYRDPAESKAIGEELADEIEETKTEFNNKSVVLMKNSDDVLPLTDTSVNIYVRLFNGTDTDTEDTVADELEAMGYNIVDDYEDADVAILMVVPEAFSTSDSTYMHVLDLVEAVEVDEYTTDDETHESSKTGYTVEITTVAAIDELWEIADAVHANGGTVIGTIDISSPWILTNLEPYCDALLGLFSTSDQAVANVISGEYSPTGKLPITMVSCAEVIAVNEETLEDGNTYEICVSPNDVPGYDKDQYIDEEVLAQSPSGSYCYMDSDGNYYWSGFGLSY